MEIKEFIRNFIGLFDDEPTCEVTSETVFRDMDGWCSIVALSFMSMVDEEYDVQLTADEMRKANTIGDLFNTVSSKV